VRGLVFVLWIGCSRGGGGECPPPPPAPAAPVETPRLFRGRIGALQAPPVGGTGETLHFLSRDLELKLCSTGPASREVECRWLPGPGRFDTLHTRWPTFGARLADSLKGDPYPIVSMGERAPMSIREGVLGDREVMPTDAWTVGVDRSDTFVHVSREIGVEKDGIKILRKPKEHLSDRNREAPVARGGERPHLGARAPERSGKKEADCGYLMFASTMKFEVRAAPAA
jgi:hypothetical protein